MAFHVVIQKFEGKSRGRTVRFIPGQIIDDLQYDFGQLRPDGLNVIALSPAIQTAVNAFNEQYHVKDPVQPLLGALVGAGLVPVAEPQKGSILVGDGEKWVELVVGADTEVLTADSTATEGLDWKPASAASTRYYDQPVTATANPLVFTSPTLFRHGGLDTETLYYNGQRLLEGSGCDYVVSESGGVGTGYDTITLVFTPMSGANWRIDLTPFP